MGEVSEILPEPRFTALPGVKPWLKGVANVRGRLLPIADLGQFLGVKIQALRKQRRILIVDHGDLFVGLAVDEVLGMQHFDIEAYREHADSVPAGLHFFLEGVFQRDVPWLVCSRAPWSSIPSSWTSRPSGSRSGRCKADRGRDWQEPSPTGGGRATSTGFKQTGPASDKDRTKGTKVQRGPLMNKLNTGKLNAWVAGMFVGLIVAIVLLFANFAYLGTQTNYDNQYQGQATELRILSQQLAKSASEAATGKADAFKDLRQARANSSAACTSCAAAIRRPAAGVAGDPPPASGHPGVPVGGPAQAGRHHARQRADRTVPAPAVRRPGRHHPPAAGRERRDRRHPDRARRAASQVVVAQRQALLAERILGAINKILTATKRRAGGRQFWSRRQPVRPGAQGHARRQCLHGHRQDHRSRGGRPPQRSQQAFEFVSGKRRRILATSPELLADPVRRGSDLPRFPALLGSASDLSAGYASLAQSRKINTVGSYLLVFIALGAILCIGYILVRDTAAAWPRPTREPAQPDRHSASAGRDRRPRRR